MIVAVVSFEPAVSSIQWVGLAKAGSLANPVGFDRMRIAQRSAEQRRKQRYHQIEVAFRSASWSRLAIRQVMKDYVPVQMLCLMFLANVIQNHNSILKSLIAL